MAAATVFGLQAGGLASACCRREGAKRTKEPDKKEKERAKRPPRGRLPQRCPACWIGRLDNGQSRTQRSLPKERRTEKRGAMGLSALEESDMPSIRRERDKK